MVCSIFASSFMMKSAFCLVANIDDTLISRCPDLDDDVVVDDVVDDDVISFSFSVFDDDDDDDKGDVDKHLNNKDA